MDAKTRQELDRLVRERGGLVNAHAHLDIARIIRLPMLKTIAEEHGLGSPERLGELPLQEKIDVLDSRLRTDPEYLSSLHDRVTSYLDEFVAAGGRACRTCVTVSSRTDPSVLDVFAEIKRAYAGRLELQLAALHLQPILHDPAERDYFRTVCAQPEIDLISGLPQHHPKEVPEYVKEVFAIARSTDKAIEIHADEYLSPDESETAVIAEIAGRERRRGFAKSISVVHGITLGAKPAEERHRVGSSLAEADVTLVTCPRSAISIGRKPVSNYLHNAIAPVVDLMESGVRVAVGTDNIADVFLPLSSGDLLTEAEMLAETQRFYDLSILADMLTINGARALEL